jgi:hypothetical protein
MAERSLRGAARWWSHSVQRGPDRAAAARGGTGSGSTRRGSANRCPPTPRQAGRAGGATQIWYHRTSGIWQPIWLEPVPANRISKARWVSDVDRGALRTQIHAAGEHPALPCRSSRRRRLWPPERPAFDAGRTRCRRAVHCRPERNRAARNRPGDARPASASRASPKLTAAHRGVRTAGEVSRAACTSPADRS